MGNSLLLSSRYETAEEWLNQARRGFEECSDSFGAVVAQLMLCLNHYRQSDWGRLESVLPGVLSICRQRDFDFLFSHPTLLAVPDERMLTPLLVYARRKGLEPRYVEAVLRKLGLSDLSLHPGYQLKAITLGGFETARGPDQIPPNGWVRTASRQLWQLLLTHYDAPLDREQIFEHLWPGLEPAAAQRNFKVALNTLYKVLEPDRPPGVDSAFILREGTVYGFRPGADMQLDVRDFVDLVRRARALAAENPQRAVALFEEAVGLYGGDYLPEARYETWVAGRREQLAVLFLQSADRLCELYLDSGKVESVLPLAGRILEEDPCWERAYQHLMQAYTALGDHGQAARTYQRCVAQLREEMDVAPSEETEALYRRLQEKD
jgi:DNA-binding SARP family transcriptional activator